jgi:hypothetical protein
MKPEALNCRQKKRAFSFIYKEKPYIALSLIEYLLIKSYFRIGVKRMFKSHKIIGMLLALMLAPLLAHSKEQPADLQPLEEIPPPTIATEGDPDEPEVTIVKKGNGETVEEYRLNGQLYMMKVTPSNGVPYYLHKEDQEGGWTNDGPNPPLSIPKWTIFRF